MENRNDPAFAAALMEKLCPSPLDRILIIRQLIRSIEIAQRISSDVWALTLFDDGFRLNVGPVEVMTFFVTSQHLIPAEESSLVVHETVIFEIRLLLHGNIGHDLRQFISEDKDTHGIVESNYKSVPAPQYIYVGLGEIKEGALSNDVFQKIETALGMMTPLHAAFIHQASHTPSGRVRKTSSFRRSHSDGLYLYAESFSRADWRAPPRPYGGVPSVARVSWSVQEEFPSDEQLVEGASITVKVNAY